MTKLRFICPTFGAIPEEAEIIMRISRATVEAAGHEWETVRIPAEKSPHHAAIQKDLTVLELSMLPGYANAVFIDWDIEIRRLWDMSLDRPYFIFEWGTPRVGMFSPNGHPEFFVALENERKARNHKDVYGYPNKVLHNKGNFVGEIPVETYIHYRFTSNNQTKGVLQ